jgi:hypothetical protein
MWGLVSKYKNSPFQDVIFLLSDKDRIFQITHDTLTKAIGYILYPQVIDARSVVP